jgi:predicted nucleic acid-binding protein
VRGLIGMAGNSYLLDTNIVVAILNQESAIEQRLKGVITYVSSIVLGELYFGAYKSGRPTDNLKRIEIFIAGYPLLNCDKSTADQYGQIKFLRIHYPPMRPFDCCGQKTLATVPLSTPALSIVI